MSRPPTNWLRSWLVPDGTVPGEDPSSPGPLLGLLSSSRVHVRTIAVALVTLAAVWALSAAGVVQPARPALVGWTMLAVATAVYAVDAVLATVATSPLDAAVDAALSPLRWGRWNGGVVPPRLRTPARQFHMMLSSLGSWRSGRGGPAREAPAEAGAAREEDEDAGSLEAGDVVDGTYELRERIGSGAVSTVWRATRREDGRTVAVSTYEPSASGDSRRLRRDFHRGAEVLERLSGHPNVVDLYGRGTRPVPWMAMEYVPGGSLDEHLPLPLPQAVSVLAGVARAVAHGHDHDAVHGDIKPSNVLITDGPDGPVPKVTDWARRPDVGGSEASMLTPSYAAPEQFDGAPASDTAVDVYQLGVLGYELLTGRRAVAGDGQEGAVLVPPSSVDEGLPAAVDGVIARATATDPDERFPSVDDLLAALPAPDEFPSRLPAGADDATAGRDVPPGDPTDGTDAATTVVDLGNADDETTVLSG